MSSRFALTATFSLLLALILACGGTAPAEQVVVEKEVVTEREVVKEVPRDVVVEKEVVREVIKEVPVVKEVLRDAPSKPDPRPGKISWTSGQSLASPDSHVWAVGGDGQIFRNTFEGITQELGYGVAGPALAEDWTLDSDNVTWTFNLRKGVKFHNGDPVTAEDVQFSILRLRDSPTGNLKFQARHVEDVVVVDPDTIQLITKAPSPTNLIFVDAARVYSKAQAELDGERFFEEFIGTGPWKFDEWTPGTKFSWVRNDDWWGDFADGAASSLEHRPIPEPATAVAAVLSGGVDIVIRLANEPAEKFDDADGYHTESRASTANTAFCVKADTPPFNDAKLRLAMDYAIDRKSIVDDIAGFGTPLAVRSSPDSPWTPTELQPRFFNPDMVKQLVSESNYDGIEFRFITRTRRTPKDVEIAEFMTATWQQLGLNATLEVLGDAAFSQRRKGGDYEIFLTSWGLSNPPHNFNAHMIGHQIGYHATHPDFQKLTEAMAVEMDPGKFDAMVQDIQRYLYNDPACYHIFTYPNLYGVSDRVQELVNLPGDISILYDKTVLAPNARGQ
jgi:peptide/nickel transport system substrate-binding protein